MCGEHRGGSLKDSSTEHFLTLTDELGGDDWGIFCRIGFSALIGAAVAGDGILGGWATVGPPALRIAVESFGAIALAYTVTEELLRQAHQLKTSPWIAAMIYVGFVPLLFAAIIARG